MTTSYKRITESIEDLLGKSHYMVVKSQMDGNLTFDGHTKTVEETDNESRCRSLCTRIERALLTCREEEIPALLEMYDLLHRIGYGKMPDQRFLATQRNRVYTAWRSGNRNIQESQIFSLLAKDMRFSHKALTAYYAILDRWIMTLKRHYRFPEVATLENYKRLTLVMRTNLDRYFQGNSVIQSIFQDCKGLKNGESSPNLIKGITLADIYYDAEDAKRKWNIVNQISTDKLPTLSVQLLRSYRNYSLSLFPAVLDRNLCQQTDVVILKEILSRHHLNRYDRKAYEMSLRKS